MKQFNLSEVLIKSFGCLVVSPITVYDNDNQLWETHIGLDTEEMPLLYSCWGETEQISRQNAIKLISLLNINQ